MKRGRSPRARLYPSISANGKLVHLADVHGMPACGQKTVMSCRVKSCITCGRCKRARPVQAARHAAKRRAVGIDWSPFYDAIGRALDSGGREPAETFRTIYARGSPGCR